MDVADFDYTIFSAQQAEQDKALLVRFFVAPQQDPDASIKEGRPIFVDTDMIEIRVRGDRNNIVIHPVREDEKRRFRDAWRDYKDGAEQKLTGTPLSQWPVMSVSMVEELRFLGYFTVEQLSEANDAACSKVPGLLTMKNRAKGFLEMSKGNSPVEQLQADLAKEQSMRQADAKTVEELSKKFDDLKTRYERLLEKTAAEA